MSDVRELLNTPRTLPKKVVWGGPEKDGISYSMLCRWLQCRERFRIYTMEGLKPKDQFNHKAEYGNLWHLCEERQAQGKDWRDGVDEYADALATKYPMERDEIAKWWRVIRVQFPIYLDYWWKHQDTDTRKNLLAEQVFDVPYKLPSGRTVRLRGKWDGVDLVGTGKEQGIYLFETKTKGDVREGQLQQQLSFDLQIMLYLVALTRFKEMSSQLTKEMPSIKGVRYNVIRRPLSGGKGTIVRHKARGTKPEETWESYMDRLRAIIDGSGEDAPGPGYFFHRWKIDVQAIDVKRFCQMSLDPILEQLCQWYTIVSKGEIVGHKGVGDMLNTSANFRMPYGVNLPLLEGGCTDYDDYLRTGSKLGLENVTTFFRELET